jgi:hypothetical protein
VHLWQNEGMQAHLLVARRDSSLSACRPSHCIRRRLVVATHCRYLSHVYAESIGFREPRRSTVRRRHMMADRLQRACAPRRLVLCLLIADYEQATQDFEQSRNRPMSVLASLLIRLRLSGGCDAPLQIVCLLQHSLRLWTASNRFRL